MVQIIINGEVLDTLKSFSNKYAHNVQACVLYFIGYYEKDSLTPTIVSLIRGSTQTEESDLDLSADFNLLFSFIPSGLDVVGLFFYTQAIGSGEKALITFLQQHHKNISNTLNNNSNNNNNKQLLVGTSKKSLQGDSEELLFYSLETTKYIQSANESAKITKIEALNEISVSQLSSQINQAFFLVRVNLSLDFSLVYQEGGYTQKLQDTANSFLDTIKTGNFILTAKDIVLNGNDEKTKKSLVSDLLAPLKKGANVEWIDTTALVALSSAVKKPPTLTHNQGKEPFRQGQVSLQLSVLNYTTPTTTLETFIKNVSSSLYIQAHNLVKSGANPNIRPAPFHFLPPKFPHPITLVYPIDKTASHSNEDYLLPVRTNYHRQLLLPVDKPLLRDGNKITFDSQSPSLPPPASNPLENDYRLKDVHLQLNLHEGSATGGSKYLVKGSYLYYHYQQEMNDSGWGCAYRSLQTICSWMILQGYTSKPVPTIPEIQQILVEVKDKEKKFVGSNNWIGSPEVFLCLDHLYGVSSKILNVSSGAELSQKGAELAQHFRTEGTPIMIGGGVLAYTLLGVDYDSSSGNIKFLILDPHYVGPENLNKIRDKWCSWKNGDIFRKDAFYNLCMPLRPKKV